MLDQINLVPIVRSYVFKIHLHVLLILLKNQTLSTTHFVFHCLFFHRVHFLGHWEKLTSA
jgi:hypothetical protein